MADLLSASSDPVLRYERGQSSGLLDRQRPPAGDLERRIRAWVRDHRPPFAHQGRSWFVILSALCVGMALIAEPGYFFALAVVFAVIAWWRRESARNGVLNVAVGALTIGFVAMIAAIAYYFVMPLFVS